MIPNVPVPDLPGGGAGCRIRSCSNRRAVDAAVGMVERCGMKQIATIVMASLFALLVAAPGAAQSAGERVTASNAFAQSEPRARTRLRVRAIYPYRHYNSFYPVPYDIEYPGPYG